MTLNLSGLVKWHQPLITQRDPRWWIRPDEFIPERFLEGHDFFHQAPKHAFIPFSIGKRNCIGSRFALLEMALFSIHFFKTNRVSTTQKNIKMKGFVTLKSDEQIRITVSTNQKKAPEGAFESD